MNALAILGILLVISEIQDLFILSSNYRNFKNYEKICIDEKNNTVNLKIGSVNSYRTESDKETPDDITKTITDEICSMEKFVGLSCGSIVDIVQIRRENKESRFHGHQFTKLTSTNLFRCEKMQIVLCPSEYQYKHHKEDVIFKQLVDHEIFHAIDDHFGFISNDSIWVRQFQYLISKENSDSTKTIFFFIDKVMGRADPIQSNRNVKELFAQFATTLYSEDWEYYVSNYWCFASNLKINGYEKTLFALDKIINNKNELKDTDLSRLIKKRIKFINEMKNR